MRDYNENNRIGKILGKRRVELGLTQEYIALEVGIATAQYQRFEYGVCNLANGYLKYGLKICLLLELDPYELLFEGDVWGDESPVESEGHSDWRFIMEQFSFILCKKPSGFVGCMWEVVL